MQDLADRLADLVVTLGGRVALVVVVVVALVVGYLVLMAVIRRVAARAAATPHPGEAALEPDEQALRQAAKQRRLDTLVLFASRLGRFVVVALAVLVGISVIVPELVAALGSLGVALGAAVGVALGFGAQQLVRDYLNGILILGENPFSVGDVVAVAGIRGTVEEVGLRRTIVRDVDGVVHSVPNGEILVASNFTRTYARVNERFPVAPGTDISRATSVLDEACAELAAADGWVERFVEPPRVIRVDAAPPGESGIPILVSATVRPGEQWEVAGELRRRAMDALRRSGIDLAAGRTLLVPRPARPDAGNADAGAGDAEGDADFT